MKRSPLRPSGAAPLPPPDAGLFRPRRLQAAERSPGSRGRGLGPPGGRADDLPAPADHGPAGPPRRRRVRPAAAGNRGRRGGRPAGPPARSVDPGNGPQVLAGRRQHRGRHLPSAAVGRGPDDPARRCASCTTPRKRARAGSSTPSFRRPRTRPPIRGRGSNDAPPPACSATAPPGFACRTARANSLPSSAIFPSAESACTWIDASPRTPCCWSSRCRPAPGRCWRRCAIRPRRAAAGGTAASCRLPSAARNSTAGSANRSKAACP